jgi:hypothetical protein
MYGAATVPTLEVGVIECVPMFDIDQAEGGTLMIHHEPHWHPECSWGSVTTYETVLIHTPVGAVRTVLLSA